MSVGKMSTIILSLALFVVASPSVHAKGAGKDDKGGPIAKILKHASELKLTAEQTTKLEALKGEPKSKDKQEKGKAKGKHDSLKDEIKAILTSEQMEKVKKYLEEHKKSK